MLPLKALALCFSGGEKATKGRDDCSCSDINSVPIKGLPPAGTPPGGEITRSSWKPPPSKEVALSSSGLGEALTSPSLLSGCKHLSKDDPTPPPPSKQPSIVCPPGPLRPDAPPAKTSIPCPTHHDAHVEAMLLESMPLSLAVISSDAKEVIYHRVGLDHGAAQLLKQALQFNRSRSGVAHTSTLRGTVQQADNGASTFLAALLGPEVEAVALREARRKRFWKGTVSVQLPADASPSEVSGAHSSARQSPAEVLPMPPATMAAAAAAAAADARSRVCSAPLPEVQARYASGQAFALMGPNADAANADAAMKFTSFSVLNMEAKASGTEARDTPPAELSHGVSNFHQHEQSGKRAHWVVPEQSEALRSAFQGSGEASTVPLEMQSRTPPTSEEHNHKQSVLGPELLGGCLAPLGRRSSPGSSSFLSTETDVVEGKGGSKKKESSCKEARKEKRKPVKKCKSLYSRSQSSRCSLLSIGGDSAVTRTRTYRPEALEQLVHESNNDECTRTVALLKSISQQAQRSTVDGDHPCVSAPQQTVEECRSAALPHASPWVDLRSFLSESVFPQAELSQLHKAEPSEIGQHGCNVLHQRPTAAAPMRPQPTQPSKQASSSAVQTLERPTFDRLTSDQPIFTCPTNDTVQVGDAGQSPPSPFSEQACIVGQDPYLPGPASVPAAGTGQGLVFGPHDRPSLPQRISAHDRFSGASSQTLECLRNYPLSFDVTVSMCRPDEGSRSPLLVVISNSTEHSQVRSTLTALAESQLELLSSALPQHAIQFLAMESAEAVPEHVGQLARAHQGVTILFMDIVAFTEMSKNCKPVEVMVFLNTLFSTFDRLVDIHGVHKVETAGDCYIVSGGIMSPNQPGKGFGLVVEEKHDPKDSAKRVMEFAKSLLETAGQVRMPDTQQPVRVRVGLHTGDVVTGLIGSKLPKFSVFGDTMNTASRMESTGLPGRIHVSEATHALLENEQWEATGGVEVKGKGLMNTYLWAPPSQQPSVPSRAASSSAGMLPCMLLMHAHMLLRQFSSPPAAIQKLAAKQHSTPASPSISPAKHLGERTLVPALEVDEHELEQHE